MSTSKPNITVLVPTFNRAQFLAECLDSLLAQTLPPSQILVVNDGSTDHTLEVPEPYRSKIDYIETVQVGKPDAINRGLKEVTGDYLWIFDDDDVALSDALERFVGPLEKNLEYGFSYSPFFFTRSQAKSNRIGLASSELRIPDLQTRGFLIPLLEMNYLGGAALFARMSCYKEVGSFEPKLLRSQDYDMAIRIVRRFAGIRATGGSTFHYRQHGEARGNTRDRFAAGLRLMKWLEYDQIIFRRLYQELSLSDYLPPGVSLDSRSRQALLQRLAIMAGKLLMPEAVNDLKDIARLADYSPFSEQERLIIRNMVWAQYHRTGNPLDHKEFSNAVRRLSTSSEVIGSLRKEIFWAVLRRYKENPSLWRIPQSILRLSNLY